MNDLNSYSAIRFEFRPANALLGIAFAREIRQNRSSESAWLNVVRRFFLYGGTKEVNPRIVFKSELKLNELESILKILAKLRVLGSSPSHLYQIKHKKAVIYLFSAVLHGVLHKIAFGPAIQDPQTPLGYREFTRTADGAMSRPTHNGAKNHERSPLFWNCGLLIIRLLQQPPICCG